MGVKFKVVDKNTKEILKVVDVTQVSYSQEIPETEENKAKNVITISFCFLCVNKDNEFKLYRSDEVTYYDAKQ